MLNDTTWAAFRRGLYGCFTRGRDALMDLGDGLLTQATAQSLPEVSLSPCHRRAWPSVYTALQDGRIDRAALQRLFVTYLPRAAGEERLILGGDASSIPRPAADTARDRTWVHGASQPGGAAPVVVGWQWSTLAVLPDPVSSWVYLLDAQRIPSEQTPAEVLAAQLRAVVPQLLARPVVVADRGYGTVALVLATAEIAGDLLLRLAKNRVLYRPAPPRTGRRGAPRKDGARFACADPTTQGAGDDQWDGTDEHGHAVQVTGWHQLHFRQARHLPVTLVRVVRPHARDTQRDPRVSWFLWRGASPPPLPQVPRWYRRRFGLEHGYRFEKQHLLWTQVHVRTPEQFARWTDLVASVHNQLLLARPLVQAHRLPWQSVHRAPTPQQVRRGLLPILLMLGSPAPMPRPRGKSPGRVPGARIRPATRFPVVFKTARGATPPGHARKKRRR